MQNHRPEQMAKKSFDLWKLEKPSNKCIRCSDTSHTKGFQCPAKKFQCKVCHKFGHFTSVCYQKNHHTLGTFIPRKPKAHQLRAGALYTHQDADGTILEETSSDESFCLQKKVQKTQLTNPQLPKPVYLMTNLAYHLKMHYRRNQYLCARLDTCADVNLMPVAIYQLMFKDPSLKKLTPSTLEIETYTNDIVKIIGLCQSYLVHPENKKLIQVIFFIAKENGSVLLSCRTTMALGLIEPHAQLDYLPPRASLLTSTCDHPNTMKPHKPNIHHTKEKQIMRTLPHNADAHSSLIHMVPEDNRIITSKEQIIKRFPDVFEGIGKFPGKPYQIQLDPKVPPKQTPCCPYQYISRMLSNVKLTKCSKQVS